MKKILSVIFLLFVVLSLSSCFKINKSLKLSFPLEDITSIDIYYLEEEMGLELREELEPIYSVPRDDIAAVAETLENVRYRKTVIIAPVDYNIIFARGYAVCIEYSNGEYDVFSSRGEARKNGFYPDEYIGEKPWDDMIKSFMQ